MTRTGGDTARLSGIGPSTMLENINLRMRISREECKRIVSGLQLRLYDLEKACWDNGVPTLIVVEGWDAPGKRSTIAALTQRLDPRGFKLPHRILQRR